MVKPLGPNSLPLQEDLQEGWRQGIQPRAGHDHRQGRARLRRLLHLVRDAREVSEQL